MVNRITPRMNVSLRAICCTFLNRRQEFPLLTSEIQVRNKEIYAQKWSNMIRDTFAESPGDYGIQYNLAGNHDDGTVHREKGTFVSEIDFVSTSSDAQGAWQ